MAQHGDPASQYVSVLGIVFVREEGRLHACRLLQPCERLLIQRDALHGLDYDSSIRRSGKHVDEDG